MDPASALSVILKIVNEISSLSDEAKFNKLRCKDLKLRCRSAESYLKNIDINKLNYEQSLEGLVETLKDCKAFVLKMQTSGLITNFFGARSINQEYGILKANLDYWKAQSKEDLLFNIQQEDDEFNNKISAMGRRLERGRRLLNAKSIDSQILDKTIIDRSLIQTGDEQNNSFAFGTIHDGLFKRKHKVIIKKMEYGLDNVTLIMIKKGILLNQNLKDCDYILKVYGLTKLSDNWAVITESTTFGALNDLFKYKINKEDKLAIVRKIAAGIAYIHECDIIHKDIRSHNIMIDYNFEPKITGFEMSREVSTVSYAFTNADAGAQKWWSPERLEGKGSSKASDVYSFGILMYEISMFKSPSANKGKMFREEHNNISSDYSELMKRCSHVDLAKRLYMNKVINKLIEQEARF